MNKTIRAGHMALSPSDETIKSVHEKKEHTSTSKILQSMSKSDGSWKHQYPSMHQKPQSLQNVNVGYYMKEEDFKVLQHIQLTKRKKEKVTIDSLHTISKDALIPKALRCAPVGHLLGTDKRRVAIKSSYVSRLFFVTRSRGTLGLIWTGYCRKTTVGKHNL